MITKGTWEPQKLRHEETKITGPYIEIYAIGCQMFFPGCVALVGGANEEEAQDNARLIAAAPLQNNALHEALELIKIARKYFPKSIRNSDKFQLENTCAAIGAAIAAAEKTD